jgi:hypothetical protein
MKNTILARFVPAPLVRIFGIIALTAVIGFAIAACVTDNGDGDDPVDNSPATWTVKADGESNTTTSTTITISFNKPVTLEYDNVTIAGAATKKSGSTFTSSGNDWTIPITVGATPGTATVTVSQPGIEASSKPVTVHKQGVATPITWTAVQTGGTINAVNSTGIIITFSEAVSSLTLSQVTIGGAATKGTSAPTASGNSWTVPINVINQGLASVSITRTGVDAGTQNIEVFKLVPSLNGKTCFGFKEKVVFASNTYTVYRYDENWYGPVLTNGKYTWTVQETGSYARNGFSVTLTPSTISAGENGTMMNKSQAETFLREEVTGWFNDRMEEEGWTLAELLNDLGYPSNLTFQQAVNRYVSEVLDEAFAPRAYDYLFFDSAEEVLFMQEKLPQSNGTRLSGEYKRVYYSWDGGNPHYVVDDSVTYTFTSGGSYTLTYKSYGYVSETAGSYVCVTRWGRNEVVFKRSTRDGLTPEEYFAYTKEWGGWDHRYENENDSYASETSGMFSYDSVAQYDTTAKVIGSWDGDAFPGSASIRSFISPLSSQNSNARLSGNVRR